MLPNNVVFFLFLFVVVNFNTSWAGEKPLKAPFNFYAQELKTSDPDTVLFYHPNYEGPIEDLSKPSTILKKTKTHLGLAKKRLSKVLKALNQDEVIKQIRGNFGERFNLIADGLDKNLFP